MKKLKQDNVASIPYGYTHKQANDMWAQWINIVEFLNNMQGFYDNKELLNILEDNKQYLKENCFSDEAQRTLRRFLRKAKVTVKF